MSAGGFRAMCVDEPSGHHPAASATGGLSVRGGDSGRAAYVDEAISSPCASPPPPRCTPSAARSGESAASSTQKPQPPLSKRKAPGKSTASRSSVPRRHAIAAAELGADQHRELLGCEVDAATAFRGASARVCVAPAQSSLSACPRAYVKPRKINF